MCFRILLLAVTTALALQACDLIEVVPPDEPPVVEPPVQPPPPAPVPPYGAGNGKVIFLSDLASASRIDVTLGGESIGAVTKFVGCPSRVTADDSLATAIRPAGTYAYSARAASGVVWQPTTTTISEDRVTRHVLIGRPSQYANHVPTAYSGYPANAVGGDTFRNTLDAPAAPRLKITAPAIVDGDRIDVVLNGTVIGRGLLLGTTDVWLDLPLVPGPNWIAFRLSQDPDGQGFSIRATVNDGTRTLATVLTGGAAYFVYSREWLGVNLRNVC